MREAKTTKERPQGAMLHSSSSSSSIRREFPPEAYRSTAFGCMSGIFRLFSKHQSNRLKFLTFSGKKDQSRSTAKATESQKQSGSVEVDRTISISSPPEDITRCQSSSVVAEKRMLLLGALAKCDEDLRELKKIIEDLKSDGLTVDRDDVTEAEMMPREVKDELSSGEQPSPVSVLDEVTRSPPLSRCNVGRSLQYGNIQQQQQIKKIHEEEFLGSLHLLSIQRAAQHGNNLSESPLWCSRAMVETVEKACSEMAWGEKRERGRVGMALQDQIYRDLIDEMVKEVMEIGKMNCAQHLKLLHINGKLYHRGCRRRLSY